jgi:transposase InsO family protein
MQGKIGTKTKIGYVLPGAIRISKIHSPCKEAKKRLRWIDHYRKENNVALTCRHFGITRSLFYKWYKRYLKLGIRGLESISTKPNKFRQSKIPLEHINLVKKLRTQYPYFSKYKLAVILKRDFSLVLSASTVGRIIKKYDLFFRSPYKSKKERMKHTRSKLPKDFKVISPGDLVQSDTKHIRFFGTKRYLYVIKDCLTKMVSIQVSTSISSKQSTLAFENAGRHIPYPIRNSQNDNGSENLKELIPYLEAKNINQYFTRPRTPKDNAFVENMIGTIEREFIQQGKLIHGIKEQQELIDDWLEEYHTVRPHQALNYLTPQEYYEKIKSRN